MATSGRYMEIDISDAAERIRQLRRVHSESEMRILLRRVFSRTGKSVRRILKTELPREYVIQPREVGNAVGTPRMNRGIFGEIGCTIPITGERGTIGGRYPAVGGRYGWNALGIKRYRIKARITRDARSTLPIAMMHQGGNAPFRNLAPSSIGGVAFTRKGRERLPIMRVTGIAIPQMPMNRSRDDVQEEILDTVMKRLEHEHAYLISRCR